MSEEELRKAYTELQKQYEELNSQFTNLQEKHSIQEENITNLNNTISDLKVKNYDLFLQVSNPVQTTQDKPTQDDNVMSTADIIYKLTNQ